MAEKPEIPLGTDLAQINIVINALSLCLGYAINHIVTTEGDESASKFKSDMMEALRSGSIDMSILEDAKIFDFITSIVEDLNETVTS